MSESDTLETEPNTGELDRAAQELEEHRVEAIELRVLLDASEARLRGLGAELDEARAAAQRAEDRAETARVEAIEMRVILDATEHRAASLQGDLDQRAKVSAALTAERDQQAAELVDERGRRTVLEGLLRDAHARVVAGDQAVEESSRLRGDLDVQRLAAEGELLRQSVEGLERQQADAAHRHTTAVSKYMLELNERTEELRAAQAELARMQQELELAQQTCTDTAAELIDLRKEILVRERKVRELERDGKSRGDGLRIVSSAAEAPPRAAEADAEARAEVVVENARPLTIVHLDDCGEYRELLKSTAAAFAAIRYVPVRQIPAVPPAAPCLLMVNLLAAGVDPVDIAAVSEKWGLADSEAFTYCGDGARGVVLGMIDYLTHPFDVDACVARLLERASATHRLLVVSDNVDLMNEIRSTMARFHCSTSGALDARQAFELAALVRPDLVLTDLALPRGEGLRFVARLRADAKTANLPVGAFWSRNIDASDLHSHAMRVVRDSPLPMEDFRRAVQQILAVRGFRAEALRETA